jgi:thymidylate synthase ThyX
MKTADSIQSHLVIADTKKFPCLADPEILAMLQAFYSRLDTPIEQRLRDLGDSDIPGIKEKLNKWYVGYNHDSIGDCADIVIFFEGVSLQAAKVLEDNDLYNGVERSTRFCNFDDPNMVFPQHHSEKLAKLQRNWLDFYLNIGPQVRAYVEQKYRSVLPEDADESLYQTAVDARTFDIQRAFLPIGMRTNLSWKLSIRKTRDKLVELLVHPLKELRLIAINALSGLTSLYPSSFPYLDPHDYLNRLEFEDIQLMNEAYFFDTDHCQGESIRFIQHKDLMQYNSFTGEDCYAARTFLETRSKRLQVPRHFSRFGYFQCQFNLDFGSFRDLQRHRGAACRLPLLTPYHMFEPWYINQLPTDLGEKALAFISSQLGSLQTEYDKLPNKTEILYHLPLGLVSTVNAEYSLPHAIYVAELRSQATVHPTLRRVALNLASHIEREYPFAKIYVDKSPDGLCLRRGKQTITLRQG